MAEVSFIPISEEDKIKQNLKPKTYNENDSMVIPAWFIPSFRTEAAIQRGVEKNLLFRTWGGIGDQVCAEPTLRYAIREFKSCEISLDSEIPQMFKHLKFKKSYDPSVMPEYEKYLVFDTIVNADHFVWQFFSHGLTNCVDFPSLCALRSQLPIKDKDIFLTGAPIPGKIEDNVVFVHPGKHWQTKTFPKWWWDKVLDTIIKEGATPVLIGSAIDDNRGTVPVETANCIDIRGKLKIEQTIWLLQRAKVLLTNDSSPLHIAASSDPENPDETGRCWVGYIATCKHPDLITHWRKGQFQWREVNHGRGGYWDQIDHCPNKDREIRIDKVDQEILESWLPDPQTYGRWAVEKLNGED